MFSRQYLGTNNPAEILSEADMKYMSQLDEKSKRRFLHLGGRGQWGKQGHYL